MVDAADWKREQLRQLDQAKFEDRASRAAETKVHEIIPGEFFSAASTECRDLDIDGHYYGCISLAQAVAEGLSRFLGRVHKVGAKNDPEKRVQRLCNASVISEEVANAFSQIWGNDRNTFHHLNDDVPSDLATLQRRAKECVDALYTIESTVFAFTVSKGALSPKHPEYWPKTGTNALATYVRLTGH